MLRRNDNAGFSYAVVFRGCERVVNLWLPLITFSFLFNISYLLYIIVTSSLIKQKQDTRTGETALVGVVAERASEMRVEKPEKSSMGNQLSCSCWLLPCATTFESARFLLKINDLPVFSYRISLHGVYTAVQFDLKTLQNSL